jgi:beta-glucosidase
MMPWGAENLSIQERYKKTLEAGINLYSGTADPTQLLETVKKGMVSESLINESVQRLLIEKFQLGLLENPYVNEDAAEKIVGNPQFQARANLAMRKSIVLLRNEQQVLPLNKPTKIYFESYYQKRGGSASTVYKDASGTYPVTFVNTPEEADHIILWITPGSKSLFDSDGSPLYLALSKNSVDVKYINTLIAKKPTTLVINYTNPWVIDEIYNPQTQQNIQSVLATFGTTQDALLDVITGRFNPSGKMPFTTPISEEAAATQLSDVPGNEEKKGYALFRFNEGIGYKK